jgi:hypothetical protein
VEDGCAGRLCGLLLSLLGKIATDIYERSYATSNVECWSSPPTQLERTTSTTKALVDLHKARLLEARAQFCYTLKHREADGASAP